MRLILLFLFQLTWSSVNAQNAAPILRLETGMHASAGNQISTDREGKYLLSCSEDYTARLWDATSGQLLKILRVPIGSGKEGMLFTCALSPDGKTAAVGGYTGIEWDNSYCIYIISTLSGNILHRIKGFSNSILDLEFSPDGNWLAAGIKGNDGISILNTTSWEVFRKLDGYKGDIRSISFSKDNNLATACFDGKIRLYNNRFELKRLTDKLAGKLPISIAFNPDGTLLAVGYEDAPQIEVRSGENIELLYLPSVNEATNFNDNLFIVSFSANGQKLYAGGYFSKQGNSRNVLRCWENSGRGNYYDNMVSRGTIADIKALPNGRMAAIGTFPDITILHEEGYSIWHKKADANAFGDKDKSHLRINHSGTILGVTPLEENPLSLNLTNRLLKDEKVNYASPTLKHAGTTISNLGSYQPAINGKGINFFENYEYCYSADINSNGKEIIFGTNSSLYKANTQGGQIWKANIPAHAFAVNISANDKTVAAALSDGTIRWYSIENGKELLSYYLTTDKKRWVLFTPSGYYDASPGAEELLGWHINNGPDSVPDFYPVSRFRNQYYRPDIIDEILNTYNEKKAIDLANSRLPKITPTTPPSIVKKLPPVITILNPVNGNVNSETVLINYSLKTSENAPIKTIKILINGRPVAVERGIKVIDANNNYSVSITIPNGKSTITLQAENEHGTSPEANIFLEYKAPSPMEEFIKKPRLYILSIGISEYQKKEYHLKYGAIDAQEIAKTFLNQKGMLYENVVVKLLTNSNATRENIQDGLQWIQDQTTHKDIAMIFFAGHGINDNNGVFYMLPVGADADRLRSTCLNYEELKQTVSSIAGKVVVFVDACHSGNVMGNSARRSGIADINALVNELSNTENGAVTFTSSTGKQYSLEDPLWQHGAFTKALIEGISGKAVVPGKGKITVKSLDAYVSERVKELTKGKQHPTSVVPPNVPDFTIAIEQ